MCDPVSAGMFAVQAAGQVGAHRTKQHGALARNRQRLKQFDYENQNYINEVKLDNAQYNNDVLASEVEQEGVFKAMMEQWKQLDQELDTAFAKSAFKQQDAIVKMYENEYAGTQTGATAARRAGKSAKTKGFEIAKELNGLLLKQETADLKFEGKRIDSMSKIDKLYEKVKHPPVPGFTPPAPELEGMPSNASLMLDLAGSALMSYGFHKITAAKDTGMKLDGDISSANRYLNPQNFDGSDITRSTYVQGLN